MKKLVVGRKFRDLFLSNAQSFQSDLKRCDTVDRVSCLFNAHAILYACFLMQLIFSIRDDLWRPLYIYIYIGRRGSSFYRLDDLPNKESDLRRRRTSVWSIDANEQQRLLFHEVRVSKLFTLFFFFFFFIVFFSCSRYLDVIGYISETF